MYMISIHDLIPKLNMLMKMAPRGSQSLYKNKKKLQCAEAPDHKNPISLPRQTYPLDRRANTICFAAVNI